MLFEDRASSSRGRCERRLISLIFAGRNRIILIRRELPLTWDASPAEPVAKVRRGFSFVPAPAAAGPVLELSSVIHSLIVFVFSFWGKFLLLLNCFFCHAAICSLPAVSALIPMAQTKPSSSRPTAVMIFFLSLPAAVSFK